MRIDEEKNNPQIANKEAEIDLVKVFNAIIKSILLFFKMIIRFLFLLTDNLFNNIRVIGLFIVVGILFGLGYFYITKPYYESRMTLNSEYFKGELLDNSIQNINEVCKERNYKVLATLLKIPENKARSIKSIKLSPVVSQNYRMLIDLYTSDKKYQGKLDSLLLYNYQPNFQLNVEIYDTAALKGLDTVLVNYIKTNDYVKKRIEINRVNLNSKRDKLVRESGSLDTLKRSIATSIKSSGDAGRSGTNNVILGEKSVNPIDIYREDLQLYNQRQEIERQLALNSEIEIIEKFIPYSDPKSGTIFKNIAKGAIGGFIIAILYILYQMLKAGLIRLRYNLSEDEAS